MKVQCVVSRKHNSVVEQNSKRLREEEDQTVDELHPKKKDRSLLLGKKLDTAVQEFILRLREYGCPVNTQLVIAACCQRHKAQAMDRTRLVEAGGPAILTNSWAKSLLKRMNFTKRRASTKCSHPGDELEKEKQTFLSEILDTVALNDIPPELIFNWDQTGINLVPTALWTLDKRGRRELRLLVIKINGTLLLLCAVV